MQKLRLVYMQFAGECMSLCTFLSAFSSKNNKAKRERPFLFILSFACLILIIQIPKIKNRTNKPFVTNFIQILVNIYISARVEFGFPLKDFNADTCLHFGTEFYY